MRGPMKSKTIHGVASGNHSNPNVLRAARQMRASGGSCHPMVEGDSAPARADRPGRKAGGRVNRDMGGVVGMKPLGDTSVSIGDVKSMNDDAVEPSEKKGSGASPMSGLALLEQSGLGGGFGSQLAGVLGKKNGGRAVKKD